MITLERKVHFGNGRRSRKELRDGDAPPEPPRGRVPRISKLMALAIRLEGMIRDGVVTDQAELARQRPFQYPGNRRSGINGP